MAAPESIAPAQPLAARDCANAPAGPDDFGLARHAIAEGQFNKLRRLVAAIYPANAFYTRKLAAAGLGGEVESLAEFARRMPFTLKHELEADQQTHRPYGSNLTYDRCLYSRCHQTSGSTGRPLRWLDTPGDWNRLLDNWDRIFQAAGVSRSDRLFFAFSFGPFLGFWTAFEAALRLDCFCFPGGSMSSEARLQALVENEITVLFCTPTYAIHLGEVARQHKLASPKVRLLIVAGEAGGSVPATRGRLASLWPGARVFDHHGMTEVGPVSYECPEQPGRLHVIESAYLAEVVDTETGRAVEEGQTGELVLTTLERVGSPLLRYRTGDMVSPKWSGRCRCGGCELALEGGILGRADDMLVVRGVNIFPTAVENLIRSFTEVAEYRVTLVRAQALLELVVEIEPLPNCGDPVGLGRRLGQAFQTTFQLRVPVRPVAPGSLPRFEMKARRWVRQGADAGTAQGEGNLQNGLG